MTERQTEFTRFYEEWRDACLRAVLAVEGDQALAEDLVAEAFARAWARWSRVRVHPAPQAWVVRTALNTRISWWRRHRRESVLDSHDVAASEASFVDPALLAAARALPRRQREVIAYRVFLDLDARTTGELLGISANTVSVHLFRAVAELRVRLSSDAEMESLS